MRTRLLAIFLPAEYDQPMTWQEMVVGGSGLVVGLLVIGCAVWFVLAVVKHVTWWRR